MSIVQATPAKLTPREIRRLSPAQREAALQSAAALAEREYRDDRALASFEAFGKEDLHGDSASTQAR
jgi:hypothetical protein